MLPLTPRGPQPLPTAPPDLRAALRDVLTNPLPMQASEQILTDANDKDLGDLIADALEAVLPYVTAPKLKLVLSLAARVIRAVL